MQLAPTSSAPTAPAAPTARFQAAQALVAGPANVALAASITAATKGLAGEDVSRADLVAPLLAKTSIADLTASMQGAIDGALAVAPELVSQHDALKQALAGFTALLTEAAADTTKGAWQGTLEGFLRPLAEVSGAFTQAAALLLVPVPPQG